MRTERDVLRKLNKIQLAPNVKAIYVKENNILLLNKTTSEQNLTDNQIFQH